MDSSRFPSQEVLCKNELSSLKRCRICFISNDSLSSAGANGCLSKLFCGRASEDEKPNVKDDELLTNVCSCRGSIGAVHKSCLQKWLSISNSTSCDLCHSSFRHLLVQKPKTFSDFLASSSSTISCRSYFWVDVLSFILLTPVTTISLGLCLKGLLYYSKSVAEYISLITLMALLITTYAMWLLTCSYQHVKSYRDWKSVNFDLVVDGRVTRQTTLTIPTEVPSISGNFLPPVRTWSRATVSDEVRRQRQRIPGGLIRTSTVNEDVTMMRPVIPPSTVGDHFLRPNVIDSPRVPYPGRFLSHPPIHRINNDSLLEPYAYTNAFMFPSRTLDIDWIRQV